MSSVYALSVAVGFALVTSGATHSTFRHAQGRPEPGRGRIGQDQSTGAIPVHLRDVAKAAGLQFVHQHSPTAEKYYIESSPGGLAVFDYNGDGRPDIFFTNGTRSPSLQKVSAAY